MPTSEIYFVFGPNGSFFFDGPKCFEHLGMPSDFWNYGVGPNEDDKIQQVKCLAMSDCDEGEIFFVYEAQNGQTWSWLNNTLETVTPDLFSKSKELGPADCRVTFGENVRYIAWQESGEWFQKSQNLLSNVVDGIKIDVLALGVDDSYFVVAKNGKLWWHTKGHYPALQSVVGDLKNGDVQFVALNPFRIGEFFILFSDNTALFQVQLSYRSRLESALDRHGITCRALTSQQTDRVPRVPESAKSKDFAKGILKSVAGNVGGGIVSGIASALVGAVCCTVM